MVVRKSNGMDAASSSSNHLKLIPWIEKYRPKTVDDVSHQEEVVRTLKSSIASGQLPHLLFYGPPGTGKTSTILAVARDIFGEDFRKCGRILELNASDERGIAVVRNKIKSFAQSSISQLANRQVPPFKLIILDEADSMTNDAQSALRRMMETYSKVTRFCLICNYVSRIIEPIASRCAKFRFKVLGLGSMSQRLDYICKQENIQCNDEVVATLLEQSNGDMRKAINFLQSASTLDSGDIKSETIIDIAGVAPKQIITGLWESLKENNFNKLRLQILDITALGYPVMNFLEQLMHDVITSEVLTDGQKSSICLKLAETDKKLVDGADEYLQLMDSVAFVMQTIHVQQ